MIPQPVLQLFRGFLMGAADIVPGVSGGTIALILGIYREFVSIIREGAHALRQLVTGDIKGGIETLKSIDWLFLIPLGAGVVTAFLLLRHPLEDALIENSEGIAAIFCGLVLASSWLVFKQLTHRDATRFAVVVGVAIAAFILLGFQNGSISNPALPLFFFTGAIAICAMILPGISGSFLMLIMGMYAAVIGGSPLELLVFLFGAVLGLGGFSSLLNWLLKNYEQTVLAALLGLMLGSFRVLWPWPNGVGYTIEAEVEGGLDTDVIGTGLASWPDVGALGGAIALAAAAAVITLGVVALGDRLSGSPDPELVTTPTAAPPE